MQRTSTGATERYIPFAEHRLFSGPCGWTAGTPRTVPKEATSGTMDRGCKKAKLPPTKMPATNTMMTTDAQNLAGMRRSCRANQNESSVPSGTGNANKNSGANNSATFMEKNCITRITECGAYA
mmetsp:Transcript_67152/g.181524  ORF Transcript_67152/g.181524 Transcript_67152/m.181524 type:complete len:124 (-) Transcript_67152:407-778(-)